MPLALVTGGTGFIGAALLQALHAAGWRVRATARTVPERSALPVDWREVDDIGPDTAWDGLLDGVDCVVHLAARVHVLNETSREPSAAFRRTNVMGTARLAKACAEAGVRRFVYLSSVGVHGARSFVRPLSESSPLVPHDDYSRSKLEAEQVLAEIGRSTPLEVVILRPPLVYGPGAPGNFARLIRLVRSGWPLPLAGIDNRRSLLYLGNLVDAILLCMHHPTVAGQTFLLDDGQPVSTPELIRAVARAMDRPARLLGVPVGVLEFAGALLGKRAVVKRLTGSLWVDSSAIRSRLGWTPPYTLRQGLDATAADWQRSLKDGQ